MTEIKLRFVAIERVVEDDARAIYVFETLFDGLARYLGQEPSRHQIRVLTATLWPLAAKRADYVAMISDEEWSLGKMVAARLQENQLTALRDVYLFGEGEAFIQARTLQDAGVQIPDIAIRGRLHRARQALFRAVASLP